MKIKIAFIPQKTSQIEYAERVKNISKDLIETCAKCGVVELTYVHDWFKIHIENPQDIIQCQCDIESILD